MSTPPLTPLAAAVLRVSPAPERVLEIECGEGDGTLFLAREFPAARVRGVDRSAERIRAAAARVGLDPEGRVAFKQGSPRALPYPSAFFDLVVQRDGHPSLAEIARVLRPGAHLILTRSRHPGPMGRKPTHDAGNRPIGGRLGWVRRWRLARQGFEAVECAAAGDGSFSVGRLRDEDPAPAAD